MGKYNYFAILFLFTLMIILTRHRDHLNQYKNIH